MKFKTPEIASEWGNPDLKNELKVMVKNVDKFCQVWGMPELIVTLIFDHQGLHKEWRALDCRLRDPESGDARYGLFELCQMMHYKEKLFPCKGGFLMFPHGHRDQKTGEWHTVPHIHFAVEK